MRLERRVRVQGLLDAWSGPATLALAALVALAWTAWCLRVVRLHEIEIPPPPGFGTTFAPFVQCCHNGTTSGEWVQTLRSGGHAGWTWNQHFGLAYPASCWLASLSPSPWALARVLVVALGGGALGAWLLGWAEARAAGALAGVALYAGSGCILTLALQDYDNLILVVPLIPVSVWAARHAGPLGCALAFTALALVREEALILLPALGLAGGPRRALLAAAVAGAHFAWLEASLDLTTHTVALGTMLADLRPHRLPETLRHVAAGFDGRIYLAVAPASLPWLGFAPWLALLAVGVAAFQHLPSADGVTAPDGFFHHTAPIIGLAVSAAIVGLGRLMRLLPRARHLLLGAALALAATDLWLWRDDLARRGVRAQGTGEHPAWRLIRQVPEDAVLFLPASLAPAAARRRWVVEPSGLCWVIQPGDITHVIDDGRLEGAPMGCAPAWHTAGRVLDTAAAWRLVEVERGGGGATDPGATGTPR